MARAIVENGGAMFRHVTVRQSAGRFRLQFEWQADMMRSKTTSEDFIVTPHHLAASGIRQAQVFAVGSRLRDVIGQENEDNCITDRFSIAGLPRNDVRCAGPAQLSDVEVLALDAAGEVLEMLGSDTGFEVQVRLAQGQGGFEDAQYELHATGDLVVFEMLLIGGTFESTPRRAHVRHGAAQFARDKRLLVRRQAGNFFRLVLDISGSDSAQQNWLTTRSSYFAISAEIRVLPWAPGASAAWAAEPYGSRRHKF